MAMIPITVAWPYPELPAPHTPVTIGGRAVGRVVAWHHDNHGASTLDLLITEDAAKVFGDLTERLSTDD